MKIKIININPIKVLVDDLQANTKVKVIHPATLTIPVTLG